MTILLVSKPLCPPWTDGGKVLVRDLATHARGVRFHVMTVPGFSFGLPHVVEEAIYGHAGRHAPALSERVRVLRRVARADETDIHHYFFAPNRLSSGVVRAVRALRRRPVLQTVASVPASFERVGRLLFGDRIVCLSRWTAARIEPAAPGRVRTIPPGVEIRPQRSDAERRAARERAGLPADRPIATYAGDLEFGPGAKIFAEAAARAPAGGAVHVFACRRKTDRAAARETELRARLADRIREGSVVFAGEVTDMRALLAASDVVVMPSGFTYAKLDLPLVLLEAMAEGTPVVAADEGPVREVLVSAEGRAPEGGILVPPGDVDALACAIRAVTGSESLRASLRQAARDAAERIHDVRRCAGAHEALYAEVADGRR